MWLPRDTLPVACDVTQLICVFGETPRREVMYNMHFLLGKKEWRCRLSFHFMGKVMKPLAVIEKIFELRLFRQFFIYSHAFTSEALVSPVSFPQGHHRFNTEIRPTR